MNQINKATEKQAAAEIRQKKIEPPIFKVTKKSKNKLNRRMQRNAGD